MTSLAAYAYYSQSEDELGRDWLRQHKAEAKLGGLWQRPKGMHRTTHERLLSIIWKCEERRDDAIATYAAGVLLADRH